MAGPADPQEWIYLYPQVCTNQEAHVLLDTCSSIDLFCNQSYVHNAHQVNTMLALTTKGGVMMTSLKGELPGYSTVWFDPQAMTNVLNFSNIAKQYPV